jgi:Holliday junction resolvase
MKTIKVKQTKRQIHGQLVRGIIELLQWNGIYAFPIRQGPFSMKGISDILACKDGIFIAIEVKVGKDQLSGDQKNFIDEIHAAGGTAFVAYIIDDVVATLDLKCKLG